MYKRMLILGAVLAAIVVAVSCTTNPATGKRILNLISAEDEIRLGAEASPQFLKEYGGQIKSPEVTQYVRQLGKRLAENSERPELPWEFNVPDSPVINAFALPGGKVFITRGLMSKLDNEAQLAGVLGHEVGHVTAQHVNQRMSQALVVQGIAVGVGAAGEATDNDYLRVLGVGTGVGGGVYLLKFGRDQETEADTLGVRYMTQLGYNPYGQVQVMQILAKEAGSGGSQPEFLSTHPFPETRIKNLNALIQAKYPGAHDEESYTYAADRYKQKALQPLRQLPPPPPPKQAQLIEDMTHNMAMLDLDWCGTCQQAHLHE